MHLESWDSAFVRARRADVHPVLADVASYGVWWPGARSVRAGDGVDLRLRPPGIARRRHGVHVTVVKNRRNLGLNLAYTGDLEGEAEWYYIDEPNGTVVHYLLHAECRDRGWRRLLRDHRAAVRAALEQLKDRLEGGRLPGTEPDPALLADQVDAIKAFQAGVAAHARAQAERGQ